MNKFMKRLLAGTMALVAFATVGVSAIATDGFGLLKPEQEAAAPQAPVNNGGLEIDDVKGTAGMSLTVARMYMDNLDPGVAVAAEDAYQLTATVLPEDAADKTVTYSAAWENASSTWASGKTVSDYVTVTQTSTGSLTATATCKQAFGEPIIVTVTSNDNPDAKATATLHFRQKIAYYELSSENEEFLTVGHDYTQYGTGTDNLDVELLVDFNTKLSGVMVEASLTKTTVYTREKSADIASIKVVPTNDFVTAMRQCSVNITTIENTTGADIELTKLATSSEWIKTASGGVTGKRNAIINAILNFKNVAYTVTVTDTEGTTATFNITLDSSMISGQKSVESVSLNNVELEF